METNKTNSTDTYFKYNSKKDTYVEMIYDAETKTFIEASTTTSKPTKRTKRTFTTEPLFENQIKQAQRISKSAAEAARNLKVSYNTYKKYAKMYGIFDNLKNPDGHGIRKGGIGVMNLYNMDDIFNGKYPRYAVWKLKRRLLNGGYMEEKCSNCGFCERRIIDYKVPLILDFIDADRKNFKYDNLRMLCYNCSFLINGDIFGKKREFFY